MNNMLELNHDRVQHSIVLRLRIELHVLCCALCLRADKTVTFPTSHAFSSLSFSAIVSALLTSERVRPL